MRLFILIIGLFLSFTSISQVTAEKVSYDFGDMYANSPSYYDFRFTNNSDKVQFLLTIDKPQDVYYIFSAKKLLPDSSITIRLKVNTDRKGKFNHTVDIYFSEPRDPITITVKGNIKELAQNPMTGCPDFNSTPTSNGTPTFAVTIKVIDSITREPIKNAQVYLVERGELVGDYKTNRDGIVHKPIPYGFYYITASEKTYISNYHEGYLNFNRNYVEIELSRSQGNEIEIIPEDTLVVDVEPDIPPIVDSIPEEVIVIVDPPPADNGTIDTIPEEIDISLEDVPDSVFNDKYFKYSNITFILDVSSSMNSAGKMDLLKLSMIELVKILRPEDNVSVIKYSSEVETLLAGTSGDKKEEIIDVVRSLKTSGFTAGGNAIKAGYKLNKKEYIKGGNNLVIMVTDGIFNKGDKDYLKTIRSNYDDKGIRFSVVGIKTSEYITGHMMGIVSEGGGDFVRILTVDDAKTKLIEEIKRTSFKGQP